MQKGLARQDKAVVHYHDGSLTKVIDNKRRKQLPFRLQCFFSSVVEINN